MPIVNHAFPWYVCIEIIQFPDTFECFEPSCLEMLSRLDCFACKNFLVCVKKLNSLDLGHAPDSNGINIQGNANVMM